MLGGRCRKCRTPISIRYPIVELVTMAIFVLHYFVFGADIILVPRLLFACALIVLFAIDLEHHLLPNVITLPGHRRRAGVQHDAAARPASTR